MQSALDAPLDPAQEVSSTGRQMALQEPLRPAGKAVAVLDFCSQLIQVYLAVVEGFFDAAVVLFVIVVTTGKEQLGVLLFHHADQMVHENESAQGIVAEVGVVGEVFTVDHGTLLTGEPDGTDGISEFSHIAVGNVVAVQIFLGGQIVFPLADNGLKGEKGIHNFGRKGFPVIFKQLQRAVGFFTAAYLLLHFCSGFGGDAALHFFHSFGKHDAEVVMLPGVATGQDTVGIGGKLYTGMGGADVKQQRFQFLPGDLHQPQTDFGSISQNAVLDHLFALFGGHGDSMEGAFFAEKIHAVIDKVGLYLGIAFGTAYGIYTDSHIAFSPWFRYNVKRKRRKAGFLMAKKTVLYFAPHQDDELLSMGLDICRSVEKKWDVHVILCADGARSYVRGLLNDGKDCGKHEGIHCYELTEAEFVAARDREFIGSCLALGVPRDHIHIPEKRAVDGSVTVEEVEAIMLHYLQELGQDAYVCTFFSGNGPEQHRDHKAVGRAAENLLNRGVIRELKSFVEPYLYHKIIANSWILPVDPYVEQATQAQSEKLKKAIGSYSLWDPEQQRYAVGYHSVTTEFNDFLKNRKAYWMRKQRAKDMTRLDRITWRHRQWRKFFRQKQLYYSMAPCEAPELGDLQLVRLGKGEEERYRAFCAERGLELRDKDIQRLMDGSSFWCLCLQDGTVVTTGWLTGKHGFYIGETDYGFSMEKSESAIAFDFKTMPEHRKKGYYVLLLRSIAARAEAKCFIAYTSAVNIASQKGILRAGFHFDGALTPKDGSIRKYLRKHGFTGIYRRQQLMGLRTRK